MSKFVIVIFFKGWFQENIYDFFVWVGFKVEWLGGV